MNWFRRNWLYILAFTLPFERIPSYDLAIGSHSVTLRMSFVIALLVILGCLWRILRTRRLALTAPDWWLAGYGLVMLLSVGIAADRGRSLQVIVATSLLLGMAMALEHSLQRFSLDRLWRWLLAGAGAACLFGLYQFFGDSYGLPTAWTGMKEIYTKFVFGFPRVQSVGVEPLFFASFLMLPITLLVMRIYTKRARWTSYAMLAGMTMVLALTLSRGGIYGSLAALAVLVVWLWRYGSKRRLALIAVSIGVGAGGGIRAYLRYYTHH